MTHPNPSPDGAADCFVETISELLLLIKDKRVLHGKSPADKEGGK